MKANAERRHDEHCRECKISVARLLRSIYGGIEQNYRFALGVRPDDYRSHELFGALQRILSTLEAHRGFRDFIRAPSLPDVDYFVPDPGFILEFDEAQHFTLPRRIALENYPASLPLGFSIARWKSLCAEIAARDDEPPFRDEQRAWYDTLRDFAPAFNELQPTVRLYAGELEWCGLDAEDGADAKRFRDIIETKRQSTTIP